MRAVVVVICCKGPPFIKVKWPSDPLMLDREVEESKKEQHVGIVKIHGIHNIGGININIITNNSCTIQDFYFLKCI